MKIWLLFCTLFLPASLSAEAPGLSGDAKSLAGTWEGALIWAPAEVEIDLRVDLGLSGQEWSGRLSAPAASVEGHVLAGVSVQGRTVVFEHMERPSRGSFRGTLSDDGGTVEGEFSPADGGRTARFVLHRAGPAPAAVPDLAVLGGAEDLQARFNFDQGAPRLVLLLAPTCEMCRMGARLTQRYALEAIDDPRLRVYVIWLPMTDEDTRQTALRAAGDLPDSRVRHFWVGDMEVARVFATTLGLQKEPAWDVFLVYGPGAVWSAGVPPVPQAVAHRSSELPRDSGFNAARLAAAIRQATAETLKR